MRYSLLSVTQRVWLILRRVLAQRLKDGCRKEDFGWQCLLWSHPGNHQSLFRGKVQTIHLVPPLLGYFLEESERVSGRCCFWVSYVARILHGGVIIETKQLLLTGLTVLIAFVHLWELSKTSRVFCLKTLHCCLFNYERRENSSYARSFYWSIKKWNKHLKWLIKWCPVPQTTSKKCYVRTNT